MENLYRFLHALQHHRLSRRHGRRPRRKFAVPDGPRACRPQAAGALAPEVVARQTRDNRAAAADRTARTDAVPTRVAEHYRTVTI